MIVGHPPNKDSESADTLPSTKQGISEISVDGEVTARRAKSWQSLEDYKAVRFAYYGAFLMTTKH